MQSTDLLLKDFGDRGGVIGPTVAATRDPWHVGCWSVLVIRPRGSVVGVGYGGAVNMASRKRAKKALGKKRAKRRADESRGERQKESASGTR